MCFYQALSLGSLALPFPPLSCFLQSCVLAALLELPSFLQVGCSMGHDVNSLLSFVCLTFTLLTFICPRTTYTLNSSNEKKKFKNKSLECGLAPNNDFPRLQFFCFSSVFFQSSFSFSFSQEKDLEVNQSLSLHIESQETATGFSNAHTEHSHIHTHTDRK